jgi:hypothetical protein
VYCLGDRVGIDAIGSFDADHRKFAFEGNKRLGHRVDAEFVEGGSRLARLLYRRVAAAVVTAFPCFQHDAVKFLNRELEVFLATDANKIRNGNPGVGESFLLDEFVLDRPERTGIGVDRHVVLVGNRFE